MYAVSKCAPQEALRTLDNAFAHCFRRCTLKQEDKLKGKQEDKLKGTLGYPQRKTKQQGRGSFPLTRSFVPFPHPLTLPPPGPGRPHNPPTRPHTAPQLSPAPS